MNLIFTSGSESAENHSGKKNPYCFSLKTSRLEDRILSWFYRQTAPFFATELAMEEELSGGLRISRKENASIMEWDLRQSTRELLFNDIKYIMKRIIPGFLLNGIRDIRNYIVIFFSVDDMELEEALAILPADEQERVIRVQQKVVKVQHSAFKMARMTSRNMIHFTDAMRIIMLRSLYRIKRLPGLLHSISMKKAIKKAVARAAGKIQSTGLTFVKKIPSLLLNARK